jgi:hypothetical protein
METTLFSDKKDRHLTYEQLQLLNRKLRRRLFQRPVGFSPLQTVESGHYGASVIHRSSKRS